MSNFSSEHVVLDWTIDAAGLFPDADQLVSAVHQAIVSTTPPHLAQAVARMGPPAIDVLLTPMSARAAVLGMQRGLDFSHHELRRRIAMPPGLEPEVDVWEHGTVPVWREGVLTEPKYFSFFQDAPLPIHNPNYRRKWRAHELLHGAVGFFWHPEQSRFEAYVGARLNEVLPVVHWYGTDELFRPRCAAHRGQLLHREFCARCEALAAPYWTPMPGTELPAERGSWLWERAEYFARHAREHLAGELAACREEIETGRVVSAPQSLTPPRTPWGTWLGTGRGSRRGASGSGWSSSQGLGLIIPIASATTQT